MRRNSSGIDARIEAYLSHTTNLARSGPRMEIDRAIDQLTVKALSLFVCVTVVEPRMHSAQFPRLEYEITADRMKKRIGHLQFVLYYYLFY